MITISVIVAFLAANPAAVGLSIAAIYELIARRKPTRKDWSIINLIKFVVDFLIKNRNDRAGLH
jgi:hypothetical protein